MDIPEYEYPTMNRDQVGTDWWTGVDYDQYLHTGTLRSEWSTTNLLYPLTYLSSYTDLGVQNLETVPTTLIRSSIYYGERG